MAKRIVIADDSATIQRAFAMTFGAEDVTLVAARSVEEGLALARQIQPELVIADGMMPGRSGYDLCAAIKSDPALGSTAVYVLASAQQPYDESRGRQCGADGFFVKPFDTAQIIEKVHEALAKGPTEVMRPAPATSPSPFSDDFGPPIPLDGRSPIPLGLGTPLASASDDDEYGEISVDILPVESDEPAPEREAEYAAAPATPLPAARPSLTPPPTYVPAPGATPAPAPLFLTPGSAASPLPTSGSAASHFPTSGSAASPLPISGSVASPLPTPGSAASPLPTAASMRPSLIPGIRPGAVAPARPGAAPTRPAGGLGGGAPMSRPPAPVARTLMGLPAANVPIPGSSRPAAPPMARPAPAPPVMATPAASASPSPSSSSSHSSAARPVPMAPPAATPSPLFSSVPAPSVPSGTSPTVSAVVSAAVGAAVDQKIAAISARGPEYEAIAKLSREIIEQIVWEVVPELAEVIIREHVERHVRN
jgi:CheY-like chemotaxis protein